MIKKSVKMAEPKIILSKPKSVTLAIRLLLASMVLIIPKFIFKWDYAAHLTQSYNQNTQTALTVNDDFTFYVQIGKVVITIIFLLWIVLKISAGRNWARILFLIMYIIIGVPLSFLRLKDLFASSLLGGFLVLLNSLLQMISLRYLYSSPSNVWFKSIKMGSNSIDLP